MKLSYSFLKSCFFCILKFWPKKLFYRKGKYFYKRAVIFENIVYLIIGGSQFSSASISSSFATVEATFAKPKSPSAISAFFP